SAALNRSSFPAASPEGGCPSPPAPGRRWSARWLLGRQRPRRGTGDDGPDASAGEAQGEGRSLSSPPDAAGKVGEGLGPEVQPSLAVTSSPRPSGSEDGVTRVISSWQTSAEKASIRPGWSRCGTWVRHQAAASGWLFARISMARRASTEYTSEVR